MSSISIDVSARDITIRCPFPHDTSRYGAARCPSPYNFGCDGSVWGKVNLEDAVIWLVKNLYDMKEANDEV